MKKRTIAAVVGLAAALALTVLGGPSVAGRARIRATSSQTWSPDFKHVVPGTRVIWKNPTSVTHNVTAYSSNWSKATTIPAGERTRKRFKKKGTFKYRCTIHSTLVNGDCNGMCGVVHVADN